MPASFRGLYMCARLQLKPTYVSTDRAIRAAKAICPTEMASSARRENPNLTTLPAPAPPP